MISSWSISSRSTLNIPSDFFCIRSHFGRRRLDVLWQKQQPPPHKINRYINKFLSVLRQLLSIKTHIKVNRLIWHLKVSHLAWINIWLFMAYLITNLVFKVVLHLLLAQLYELEFSFHQPTLMHNYLYSLTICLLHYYPRHVSSINMPIFSPLSTSVLCRHLQRAKIPDAVWIQFFLLKMGMLMLETCRA